MRYGVIADVHANLHALDASLAFLSTQDVGGYLCAGDLVGYGPFPNESVRRVLDLDGACVAGNHDLITLGRLSDERCIPLARDSLRWTRDVLDDDVRALLGALPATARVDGLVLCHAWLDDPQPYVVAEQDAMARLRDLDRAGVVIAGHTHRPMAVAARTGTLLRGAAGTVRLPPGEPVLVNPGAVGQSRTADPRARVMVLDTEARTAAFHALPYDVAACRDALRERGLPANACHLAPSRWRDAASAVGHRVRRLRAASRRR
jgi:diadenosine tetraphosphatase ApaH/serine/threonine PP2A family protein phosphatase